MTHRFLVFLFFSLILTTSQTHGQEVDVTPLKPLKPDPALNFLQGLKWAMEGPESPNFDQAVLALQDAANNRSRTAQLILGKMLIQSRDPEEFVRGLDWLKKASANGEAKADIALAYIFRRGGPGIQPDTAQTEFYLKSAANKGHPNAPYALARMIDLPNASKNQVSEALRWYGVSAERGNLSAQLRLGYLYQTGTHVSEDPEQAIKWYSMAAQTGNIEAIYNLAQVFDFSSSEYRDGPKAAQLYKQAADAGHQEAQLYYAQKILQGDAESGDLSTAIKILETAGNTGQPIALFQVGLIKMALAKTTEDAQKALNAIESAAQSNLEPAIIEMARICYFGVQPYLKPNKEKALSLYDQLAKSGHKEAQALLGYIHQFGEGTDVNLNQAANWYLKAANDGSTEAQYNLGMLYLLGNGVERDSNNALKWLTEAAHKGHPMAALNVGVVYKKLNDQTKAVEWFRKAAENGNDNAAYYLGIVFDESIRKDIATKESLKWFREAAKSGNARAQYSLAFRLMENPNPRENMVEAFQWLEVAVSGNYPQAQKAKDQLATLLTESERKRAQEVAGKIIEDIQLLSTRP